MEGSQKQQDFIALYEGIYQDLYRFALYTLRNVQDAEDVVGDTVADAYAGFGKLRNKDSFHSWIFRILSNKCKRKLKEYVSKTVELPEELSEEILAEHTDMEENYQVRQAFFKLDEEERMIISMHIFAGYTSRETAKILHKNENTIRSRESRALKKMEQMLR